MMKRIIALLLALILTVSLLPTVALAADGDTPAAGTSSDVKNGYYEDTTWKEGTLNQGKLPTPRPRNRPRTLTSTKSRWRLS